MNFAKFTSFHLMLASGIVLSALLGPAFARSPIKIQKTIKEELLPGSMVAKLKMEPALQNLLENARTAPNGNGTLSFSVLTSAYPSADYFTVEPTEGVISIRQRLDRETVCSFQDDCLLDFEIVVRSVLGPFFQVVKFAVTVLDINDNAPMFSQPGFVLYVPEESDAGRRYPLPTALDEDTGPGNGVKEYRLLESPEIFSLYTEETELNTTDVFLTLDSVVNREKSESYKVKEGLGIFLLIADGLGISTLT